MRGWRLVQGRWRPGLVDSGQLQVQQRVWSPSIVGFASTDNLETATSIELHGLPILFIHVDVPDAVVVDCVAEKTRADTGAALLRVDEQHLQVSVEDAGESHRSTIQLRDSERNSGEIVRLQSGFDLIAVRIGEEFVSRVDRASPDRDEGRKVNWSASRPNPQLARAEVWLLIHASIMAGVCWMAFAPSGCSTDIA